MQPEEQYLAFLAQGRFMLQRAKESGTYVFFPRVAVPGTGETDLEWVEASGDGTVYSTTVVRSKPPAEDYNVALIDLAEGVRMMGRVVDIDPAAVQIGLKVKAKVGEIDGKPAILFTEAGA
ncbi:hypothetical protein CA223_22025 [Sphingomonas koreensis]|jgi:uncharacterized OB-fold protein|uniref:Zn-ribbon domain-containing OB-fold protein n=1 Tax=Sphingomonas koreensis TaxID=93064 RepID=A0A1L6J544_9SPHN|nr:MULTISPECIES: Zn-ribbon domain-containing OB-fold protein [Sphingomonas]APR51073.1 hypothetical protein BRX40_00265 [Sphingomonas koreensis]MCR5870991.1 Zn-ribbon domain-containing OB-fold protein [Sphingomonas sp. J344]MDC7810643.1 Zn-ribbon domain-containing OB-fold protein [Sphingomonas koreensis]RSU17174.1 hypothetical protein CA224_22450 [Sphingomonas koreensis]RSU19517.1 hypothetical protein CA222_22535 [Sphingomonas koreensis]